MKWEASLQCLYQSLAQGLDASPAVLLGLEGQIHYLLNEQRLDWQQCQDKVEACYQENFNHAVPAMFWLWCVQDGIFRLPYQMLTAPVNEYDFKPSV